MSTLLEVENLETAYGSSQVLFGLSLALVPEGRQIFANLSSSKQLAADTDLWHRYIGV